MNPMAILHVKQWQALWRIIFTDYLSIIRAAQLAYFAVMMKARQYDRRFFSRGIQPHVYAIVESNHVDKFAVDYFCNGDVKLTAAMDTIIKELHMMQRNTVRF